MACMLCCHYVKYGKEEDQYRCFPRYAEVVSKKMEKKRAPSVAFRKGPWWLGDRTETEKCPIPLQTF